MTDRHLAGGLGDISRRSLLKRAGIGAGALVAGPLLAACGDSKTSTTGTAAKAAGNESPELKALLDKITSKRVVWGQYGGTTEDARKAAFWDTFQKRTGVRVVPVDIPGNLGNDQLAGKTPAKWDAFHGSPAEALTALESGKKPLPKIPEIAYAPSLDPKYQPYNFQSFYVGYVPATLPGTFKGEGPRTWADFFDTKKFPGKRSWPGVSYTPGTREAALMADGVNPDELYPLDIERAHHKIKSILPDLLIYNQFPQAQSFLTSKSVSISFGPNGMWKGLALKGVKTEILWDMVPILQPNSANVMPDAPDMDAVLALAAWCAQPELQAEFCKRTTYGPTDDRVFDLLTAAERDALPNAPGRTVAKPDIQWLADNEAALLDDNKKLFS
ncbi:extracellular solute-binding protein [Patulibacter defluvii]|uniref:extracellular solute-binding protein n=1 Tax=Patulibacter defluvii TaxID=3095358 RepID=UPI002A74B836|nr:extracellular solute-binding protein [Patulibacter sp. DM4]